MSAQPWYASWHRRTQFIAPSEDTSEGPDSFGLQPLFPQQHIIQSRAQLSSIRARSRMSSFESLVRLSQQRQHCRQSCIRICAKHPAQAVGRTCANASLQVIIDGKGHLLGRLASIVAKQLLNGQRIVVVRCEQLNISGEFFRAKRKSFCLQLGGDQRLIVTCSEVPSLPPQTDTIQPDTRWSMALPHTIQDVLANSPRHDPTQDGSRSSRHAAPEVL